MQNFLLASALINGIVSISAAVAVYYKNKKADINNTFAVFCLFLAFWAFGSFFMMLNPEQAMDTLPSQLLRVGALFLAVANFHFVITILEIAKEKKWFLGIGYAINSLFFFLIPVHYFIQHYFSSGVVLKQISFWNNEGTMYYFWLAIWIGYVIDAIWLLISHYLKKQGVKKFQIKYILAGEIITFGALITNFYLKSDIRLISFYNILIPIQIVGFAYNIIRYRFLDVQLSLLNIFKRIIAFVFSVMAAFGVSYYLFFRREEPSILVLFPIVAVFLYFGISSFLNSRYFYRILRLDHIDDFKRAINRLYEEKLFYRSQADLEKTIRNIFMKELRISSAKIVLLSKENEESYRDLSKYFAYNKNDVLELKELFLDYKDSDKFKGLGELCFPVWGPSKKLIGFFILGSKPHKILYSPTELKVIKSAVFHITVSLRILNYHQDLRGEVARKTKEMQKQARELKKAYRGLKRLDEAKDSFFAVTAHDLRTPMTIIKGYTDFLLSGEFGQLKPKQKDFIARILSGSNEMLELINNILDINKLNTGRMDFRFGDVKIKDLIEETVKDFQLACEEKKLNLTFENPEKIDVVMEADPAKLKRVLTNLIGNAIKFTNQNGNITVRLRKAEDKMLRFEVQDDGVGIPQASQEKIFETFGQAENFLQKDYNGSGLGLSIVKRIIEKMKGKVWVESEENKGANFIFLLPQTQK